MCNFWLICEPKSQKNLKISFAKLFDTLKKLKFLNSLTIVDCNERLHMESKRFILKNFDFQMKIYEFKKMVNFIFIKSVKTCEICKRELTKCFSIFCSCL